DPRGPLAAETPHHRVLRLPITWIHVPADPQRVQVVEALLARTPQPAGEQVRVVVRMMHDAVGNDLLERRIILDLSARAVLGGGVDRPEDALQAARDQAVPRTVREDRRSGDAEDVLRLVRTAPPRPDGRWNSHASRHRAHSFTRDA